MSTTTVLSRPTRARASTWLRAGIVGGVVAGIVFAMFQMIMAAVLDGADAFFMPLRMIGAIALGPSALDPSSSLLTAGVAGLLIHMALSMMYGVAVAALLAYVPALSRSLTSTVAVASLAGFVLWVVNFFILADVFGWTWFPESQDVAVQFVAHTVMYGSVLGFTIHRLANDPRL